MTGAAGFVGSTLMRALVQRGARVHGLILEGSDLSRIEDLRGVTLHCGYVAHRRSLRMVLKKYPKSGQSSEAHQRLEKLGVRIGGAIDAD